LFCDSKEARFNQAAQIYNTKNAIASVSIPLVPNGTNVPKNIGYESELRFLSNTQECKMTL
jgi:hypothetical protein